MAGNPHIGSNRRWACMIAAAAISTSKQLRMYEVGAGATLMNEQIGKNDVCRLKWRKEISMTNFNLAEKRILLYCSVSS